VSKYVVLNLSTRQVISPEFRWQEEALRFIDNVNELLGRKADLGVLLVGSETHKEVTGL
jgi:hypothetical protein